MSMSTMYKLYIHSYRTEKTQTEVWFGPIFLYRTSPIIIHHDEMIISQLLLYIFLINRISHYELCFIFLECFDLFSQ